MKLTEKIKESTTQYILSAVSGVLGLLIGSIYNTVIPVIVPTIVQQLPKIVLLQLLSVAVILLFLLFALSALLYFKYKTKLTPKFGVYWDKNNEAFCPSCEKPLSNYALYDFKKNGVGVYAFRCVKCDKYVALSHNGNFINFDDAKKQL